MCPYWYTSIKMPMNISLAQSDRDFHKQKCNCFLTQYCVCVYTTYSHPFCLTEGITSLLPNMVAINQK